MGAPVTWAGARPVRACSPRCGSISRAACRRRRPCSPTSRRCRPTSAAMTATPVQTFARERRVELSYDEFPPLVVHAFISAEDKTFFTHHGIDYPGPDRRGRSITPTKSVTAAGACQGGSTITQQVAKYLLKDSSYNVGRKVREAILAFRLEFDADQAADPRALPQLDLPRPQRLWRAGRGARLFRQGRQRADPAGGGLSRGPSQGAGQLRSGPRDAEGARPPQLRAARDVHATATSPRTSGRRPPRRRSARSATAATRSSASRAAISWRRSAAS